MSDAGRALFAPLQRRQVGAVLALALQCCLQIKNISNHPSVSASNQLGNELRSACSQHMPCALAMLTHRIFGLVFGASQVALVSSGHGAAHNPHERC